MKKRQLLALGLLCGIILPLSTQAYEDGIYTGVDENGNEVKTVIFGGNDTFSGVQLTIKMTDQTGTGGGYYYYRGFNTPTTNSKRSGYNSPGEGVTTTETGYQYGNTYGAIRNNQWGGSEDTYENGFNPNPSEESKIARRGPCDSGYHVPSRGERNALAIAWCNLDENCNARYSDTQSGGVTGDLIKITGTYAWTQDNKLIYINRSGLGTKFKDIFNMSDYSFWSSSPTPDNVYNSWFLYLSDSFVYPNDSFMRDRNDTRVRCLRNSIIEPAPQIFTLSFTGSEGGSVSTGSIKAEEGSTISRDDEAGTVLVSGSIVATGISDEGYVFSGWLTDCDGDTVTTGCSFTGVFKLETYMITYELNGGTNSENNLTGYTIKDTITFENPTKEGYTFDGWFTDAQFTTGVTTIPTGTTGNITLYAKWTKIETKPSGGSSGGGGRSRSSSVISNDSEKSTDSETGNKVDSSANASEGQDNTQDSSANASEGQTYTPEFQQAYEFAKGKGITTMPTIQKADMDGKLTRIAMAKMLSYYAINVLGQKPDETRINKFNDITEKLDSQYDSGVTLAYQLGIMGQNMPNNKFRPNDEVTRAEFATALSRMIYHTSDGEYKSTPKYYIHHMEKLIKEGIITKDDPNMKELRGYVMIMLMRSAK